MKTNDMPAINRGTKAESFTYSFNSTKSSKEIFEVLLNVNQWWSGLHEETITGKSAVINDEFSFRAGGDAHFSKQRLIELVPYTKIVWMVFESNLNFLEDPNEWNNTKISFDIIRQGENVIVRFTHEGLNPNFECYNTCSTAWTAYMNNLKQILA